MRTKVLFISLVNSCLESFVIKVFERSVDFGQFGEMAPLYPMARAWIRNLNQGDASSWNDVPPTDEDQEVSFIDLFLNQMKSFFIFRYQFSGICIYMYNMT